MFAAATAVAILGAVAVHLFRRSTRHHHAALSAVALPLYPVTNMLDGLARSYNAINIALLPPFVLRR